MRFPILFSALALLLGTVSPGTASNQSVRFLFHLVAIEGNEDGCALRPTDVPCSQAVTDGELEIPYFAYLVVARGDTALGISGMSFGIRYDPVVEVQDWTLCASGLEFPSAGRNGPWPTSCSGNILTWLIPDDCQKHTVPGYEGEGVLAIAGVFRLVAHDAGRLRIAYHPTVLNGPRLEVADCNGLVFAYEPETEAQMGSVSFGSYHDSVNPCLGYASDYGTAICSPTPVLPVTWGRIKSLYR